ncbi:hypothetical protein PR048_020969, partial [Dryococelus australis]
MHAITLLKKEIPDVTVDEVRNDGIQGHQVEVVQNKLPHSIQRKKPDPKIKVLDTYLAAPRLAIHCNPHDWWRKNQHLYSAIAKVAAYYLALTAIQVESEMVFSTAGNIVTCRRELLFLRHIYEHIFLYDNL